MCSAGVRFCGIGTMCRCAGPIHGFRRTGMCPAIDATILRSRLRRECLESRLATCCHREALSLNLRTGSRAPTWTRRRCGTPSPKLSALSRTEISSSSSSEASSWSWSITRAVFPLILSCLCAWCGARWDRNGAGCAVNGVLLPRMGMGHSVGSIRCGLTFTAHASVICRGRSVTRIACCRVGVSRCRQLCCRMVDRGR